MIRSSHGAEGIAKCSHSPTLVEIVKEVTILRISQFSQKFDLVIDVCSNVL